MNITGRFGVIGNPIKHSLSPLIHQQFAAQLEAQIDYQKYLVELDLLDAFIQDFFANDGMGLNVTLPFKQKVIPLVNVLSDEARMANSVNTLSIQDGRLVGDTTDGAGLLYDLAGHDFTVEGKKVLVVGAGGASQSILVALLSAGARVSLLNRTQSKVEQLVERFTPIGQISAYQASDQFDGVISSTSEFNSELMKPVARQISETTFCYDLNYGQRAEAFKQFALQNGCIRFADGLGMLLGQAAKSFEIWTGQLPQIDMVSID